MTAGIYDQAAFEALCGDLVDTRFSPVDGTEQRSWVGPIPDFISALAPSSEMQVHIPDGWPVRSARITIPGLRGPHVTASGYVCLWADDDPAQASAFTLQLLLERLREWADSISDGFERIDRALDSFAMYEHVAGPPAEIDLPDILSNPTNGAIRAASAELKRFWRIGRAGASGGELEGAVYFRSALTEPPRSFDEFLRALTRSQRENLQHGLSRRTDTADGEKSGGYDFAVLVWPQFEHWDAIFLSFSGAGESLESESHRVYPVDVASRLRRAGPRATQLRDSRVLVVGAGSVGGQVALTLAASGVGHITLSDDAKLRTVNLARHVLSDHVVGYRKTVGLSVRIEAAAPWCKVELRDEMPDGPEEILEAIAGYDLVVDCSGIYSVTTGLAIAAREIGSTLVTSTLYHSGDIYRIRRQAATDVPLLDRTVAAGYPKVPDVEAEDFGFLELGCTSPVHNAPPGAVTRAAADTALVALDTLFDDSLYAADILTVLRPVGDLSPFDRLGTLNLPRGTTS